MTGRDSQWKYHVIEHAEREALNNARESLRTTFDATMYTTLFPCADCTRAIIAAGIRRLVAPQPTASIEADKKWMLHFRYSTEMLRRAHVQVQTYSAPELTSY